jgi:hypothetical protein
VVGDLDDLHLVEIDDDDQPLDRPRVAVLAGLRAHPRQRADDPALVRMVLRTGVARRPRIDHREREVLDAAQAHRRLPAGVGLHELLAGHELLGHHRRLHALDVHERDDTLLGQRDDGLIRLAEGLLVEHDEGLARDGLAGLHGGLGRLVQADEDEARGRGQAHLRLQDRRRGGDLLGRERLQRMQDRWCVERAHAISSSASRSKRPICT